MNLALQETATKDGDRDLKSEGAFGLRTVDGQLGMQRAQRLELEVLPRDHRSGVLLCRPLAGVGSRTRVMA